MDTAKPHRTSFRGSQSQPSGAALTRSFALVAALVVAAGSLGGCGKTPDPGTRQSTGPGKSVVFDSVSEGIDREALEGMRWQDVSPSAEATIQKRLIDKTLAATEPIATPPIIFFRGLLKVSAADMAGATAEWAKLNVADIPPDSLYMLWRVAGQASGSENPYEQPLAKAVAEKQAPPLVRARFHSFRGEWREALDAYLESDPADWSPFEVRTFGAMRLQAPFSRDTAVLLAGALNGGRVPQGLRVPLARLIKEPPAPDKEALMEAIRNNPQLEKAAIAGAAKALALRQAFASNQFQDVVDQTRATDPMQATDEAALLAFLSATKVKDTQAAGLWAAELLRRNPGESYRKWINSILAEAR